MTFYLKVEQQSPYSPRMHGTPLQFVSACIHPTLNHWVILVLATDGCLYSVKKDHLRVSSGLELVLA